VITTAGYNASLWPPVRNEGTWRSKLLIDEMGYLPLDDMGAAIFF
jgi:hypothetical protein